MNDTQLKAFLTPIAVLIAGFAATYLNFLHIDQATWTTIVFGGLSAVAAVVLGFFTKTSSLADTTGRQDGVTVIGPKALADALPHNPDVIATTPQLMTAVSNAKMGFVSSGGFA